MGLSLQDTESCLGFLNVCIGRILSSLSGKKEPRMASKQKRQMCRGEKGCSDADKTEKRSGTVVRGLAPGPACQGSEAQLCRSRAV